MRYLPYLLIVIALTIMARQIERNAESISIMSQTNLLFTYKIARLIREK